MALVVNTLIPVPPGRTVRARLIAPIGWYRTAAEEIAEVVTGWSAPVDDAGEWSLELPPNSAFDADGTWYRVDEPGAVHACVVPDGDGPFALRDIAIDNPAGQPCCPPPAAGGSDGGVLAGRVTDLEAETAAHNTLLDAHDIRLDTLEAIESDGQLRLTRTAAATLSGHRVVTPTAEGVGYATNTSMAHARAPLWLTLTAAAAGAPVEVAAYGLVTEPSWTWTAGALLYLGPAGQLTPTPPAVPDAAFAQVTGYAVTAITVFFDPRPPIVLS